MSYEPRPGSTAHRVIAHLETLPHGAEVLTSTIAMALGMQANSIPTCMEGALAAGAVFRRKRDPHLRAPLYWSLVNHARANGSAPAPSRNTPPEGANRDASAGQSHGAAGSESPTGRGTDGAPALGAAPVFPMQASRAGPASDGSQKPNGAGHGSSTAPARAGSHTPPQGPQHVLKAEAARPDATDRGAPAYASPGGGPTGAGQPAAAGPAGMRIALWSDGALVIDSGAPRGAVTYTADETRQIVAYLDKVLLVERLSPGQV